MKTGIWVALVGLGLSALVMELVLRLFPVAAIEIHRRGPVLDNPRFFEYEPSLGWKGRPSVKGILTGWEFSSEVRLNARGFRERELPDAKPSGTYRVVVLGDSITWGHGVGQTERFPDLLTDLLQQRKIPAEVINLGVSGYGTDQEFLLFQAEGRRYCPDLVLLGLYENDLRENSSGFQGRYLKPYFRMTAGESLVLENVPVPRVSGWEKEQESTAQPLESDVQTAVRRHIRLYALMAYLKESVRQRIADEPKPAIVPLEGVAVTALLIRSLAHDVEKEGSRFALVVLPDVHFGPATAHATRRSGVTTVLDLTASFQTAGSRGEKLFYRLDGAHWTRRAHALAAQAIAEFVTQSHLLPEQPRVCR